MERKTALTRQDLQIYLTERLTDAADGGGLMTKTALTDDENQLFNPISDVARTMGAFHARSVHAAVRRPDATPLGGAYVILSEPPKTQNVSYLLFRGIKYGEERKDIVPRIEAYSVGTIESRMTLLSVQSRGSRVIQAYQRQGEPLPLIGDVFCLRQDKKGYAQYEQYIQVIKVTSEDRTFTEPTGKDFVRTVVKMETSTALEQDLHGIDYPVLGYGDAPCKIRETHVADSAQYYGVKPLSTDATAGAMKIRVPSIMEKLVPTSQVETSLVDLTAAGQRQVFVDNAVKGDDGFVTQTLRKQSLSIDEIIYLGRAIVPNTLTIKGSSLTAYDDGGTLVLSSSQEPIGTVDYARGEIRFSAYTSGLSYASFRPAVSELKVADTTKIDISINNRSYNYVLAINPIPAPASLQVSYRAQGRWYDLYDDGSGALRGFSAAHGSGALNYASGTISLTCGELPDVGSSILFSWSTPAQYKNRSAEQPKVSTVLTLTQTAEPATLKMSWGDNNNYRASCDAAGKITGDADGYYDARTKSIKFSRTNYMLGRKVSLTYAMLDAEKVQQEHKAPLRNSNGEVVLDLGDKPITPNTVRLKYNLLIEDFQQQTYGEIYLKRIDPYKVLRDNGAGVLVDENNTPFGTIDYDARKLTFKPETTVKIPKASYTMHKTGTEIVRKSQSDPDKNEVRDVFRNFFSGFDYQSVGAFMPFGDDGIVEVWFTPKTVTNTFEEVNDERFLEIELAPNLAERIVTGSVHFKVDDKYHFDRSGAVYTDLDTATGHARKVGTIDYRNGVIRLSESQHTSVHIIGVSTTIDSNPVDAVTFRTPSSPIRAGSLQIRATTSTGEQLSAIAKLDGSINDNKITGTVDVESGVAAVKFGEFVSAAGNENEPWYQAEAVVDGKIFKPAHVLAETITYNAVAYTYLPLDTTVIGIDAVRLPQDGRVPIFRRGDMIVIGNRIIEDIGSAHTAKGVVSLSRGGLDGLCVFDNNGKAVDARLYDYDLNAGTLTWSEPLDLSTYQLPLKVKHGQEEENRIISVDIDGTLTLQFPLRRNYPATNTFVSSALIGGDLQVRVTAPFGQKAFDNIWADERRGDDIRSRLNVTDFPFVLTDDGTTTDRWAIVWRDAMQFDLFSEALGFVGRYDTLTDLAPINPATNKPYFTLPQGAFGIRGGVSGWAAGETVRFNTFGTHIGVWILRAVQPSSEKQSDGDGFTICLRGNTTEL